MTLCERTLAEEKYGPGRVAPVVTCENIVSAMNPQRPIRISAAPMMPPFRSFRTSPKVISRSVAGNGGKVEVRPFRPAAQKYPVKAKVGTKESTVLIGSGRVGTSAARARKLELSTSTTATSVFMKKLPQIIQTFTNQSRRSIA